MANQNQSARIGPIRGPVRAKMVENACMGPANGPVRAVREGKRDNYRTDSDDFRDVHLLGIQVDMGTP